jgi:peptide/nickel transport system permease protein
VKQWLAFIILLLWIVAALLGALLPISPNEIHLPAILAAPSADFWLGNDGLGRSVAERLIAGARIAFVVAFSTVLISALAGTVIGAVSGYTGGAFDHLISRVIDIMLAFPGILLAIALAAILGPGIENLIIAISSVGWVGYARLARSQAMSLRTSEHITAAIALGSGQGRIVFRHLLPLMMAPLLVEASFGLAAVMIGEAGLSFLGIGIQPPAASLGTMIKEGSQLMLVAPAQVFYPGLMLFLLVMAANIGGDALRDYLDVRSKR